MPFDTTLWQRFEAENTPIYIRCDQPNWFVPNRQGDQLLQSTQGGEGALSPEAQRFLHRLPDGIHPPYQGRAAHLQTNQLKELWFHVTDRCNLSCTHCLFAANPHQGDELGAERILELAAEAGQAGCRVFALTGGEPFVHRQFPAIIEGLLALPQAHVVILTNGLQVRTALENSRWDLSRLHLQISLDGLQPRHDRIRGKGVFARLEGELRWLKEQGIPFTLSMCVEAENVADMAAVVDFAAQSGAGNVHFMWYFIRGRGDADRFVDHETIFENLKKAEKQAALSGISIDNLQALKTQVFAPSGTIHDGSNSGWESVAVGPDAQLYPSAALVGVKELATDLNAGLVAAWRNSSVLGRIRQASAASLDSPMRFLLGGGDLDHSYIHGGTFTGSDPYTPLYEKIALWLIARQSRPQPENGRAALRLKMGDILESCGSHGQVALVHSNCLLALAHEDTRSVVREFYREAVGDTKEDILNPVCYSEELISHIPSEFRFRGYGCGSPVLDAAIQPGERVTDLGCGSGVECFIAAQMTGPTGQVTGVDMLDPMLQLAARGAQRVCTNLGYNNLGFRKGFLEDLPLENESTDVILSNCVMNLSADKRRAFGEIFRVLAPGGRLVISDVVCETEPGPAIRNDEVLHGECIAGALTQKDLVGILEESGFSHIRLIKRFPYRIVQEHPFFSLTFEAFKPRQSQQVNVIYRGPLPQIITERGQILIPGQVDSISEQEAVRLGEQIFVLDDAGSVTNLEMENGCACSLPPEARSPEPQDKKNTLPKRREGCMLCGAPLSYLSREETLRCVYCGQDLPANATCSKGHFVCDRCHSEDALDVIRHLCLSSSETDMLKLFAAIRRHPAIPLHGPEHHALIPGVVLTSYRNRGGGIGNDIILAGLQRGAQMVGGSCAFMGVCGAATGIGIAFSLILEATPLKGLQRHQVQDIAQQVLAVIAAQQAARCCQRDGWLALKEAARISQDILPIPLLAEETVPCGQQSKNAECQGASCPLLQTAQKQARSAHA